MSHVGLNPINTNAVESSAAPESALPVLSVNPWLALAVALVRPLASLFRRRPLPPLAVQRLKMESYSRTPVAGVAASQEGSKKDAREIQEGSPTAKAAAAKKGGRRHG